MNRIARKTLVASAMMLTMLSISPLSASATSKLPIDLTIDGESVSIETNETSVKNVLKEIDFKYNQFDNINYHLTDDIIHEMEIVINTEKKVLVTNQGNIETVKTNSLTVNELLRELEIEIEENDIVIPSLESKLSNNDEIAIIRFNEEEYTKDIKIDYETIEKKSFDIPYGEKVIEQEGKVGKRVESFKRIIKNEIVLSDDKISNKIVEKPVNEVVLVGTKEVIEKEIPNETVTEEDDSMFVGESKVITEGSSGQIVETYENDGNERTLISKEITEKPKNKVIAKGTKVKPTVSSSASSNAKYSLSQFQFNGVIYSSGKKFTYYSQSVLPGGGLRIPGRHVNAGGYVADKDGFIVVASNRSISKGTVIDTPFGYKGKVYDVCASCSPEWFDIYTK